jgi:septum formation protein
LPPALPAVRLPRPVPADAAAMPLMLASTSRYRRELLERLRLPFHIARPDVDEAPLEGEQVPAMAARLARAKAEAIAHQHPGSWVIGSDQAAELDGQPLGKPGHREAAIAQLTAMSGRQVRFHTAVWLVRNDEALHAQDVTTVRFRTLSLAEIERYVDVEQPFDCAGSFKSEGLGIALFDAIESSDPTALVGLPLIAVSRMLREAGFDLP